MGIERDERKSYGPDRDERKSYERRLSSLLNLKDYALSSDISVSRTLIRDIGRLGAGEVSDTAERNILLDYCIHDLTAITYPTTIDTINAAGGQKVSGNLFLWILVFLGLAALGGAAYTRSEVNGFIPTESITPDIVNLGRLQGALAVCLGFLGALVYIFFNLVGVLVDRAFSDQDVYSNVLRLVIGAIVGWLCYYAAVPDLGRSNLETAWLLLPFLAGFSSRLVVGIITQAISAVELTLGLEDKATDLRRRRLREGSQGSQYSETEERSKLAREASQRGTEDPSQNVAEEQKAAHRAAATSGEAGAVPRTE